MEKIIYTSYTEKDLTQLLSEIIRPIIEDEVKNLLDENKKLYEKHADEFISRKEAATLLKVSTFTISNLMKKGAIKTTVVGGQYRFSKKELFKYLNNTN